MSTALNHPRQTTSAASLRGIGKSYKHFRLNSIDLEIEAGTVNGLIGPNGAGKSTIMRIMMGLVAPEEGTVSVLGQPISSRDAGAKQDIGYFSDDMRLYKSETIAFHMLVRSLAGFCLHCRLPVLDVALIQQATESRSFTPYLLESVLASYLSALLTVSALLVGQRFLARSNTWLKFCADSSYWVYLIHLPIILFFQTLFIPIALPVWGKLVVVPLATWFVCSATYVVFVRYTLIGWMLNGKRTFP